MQELQVKKVHLHKSIIVIIESLISLSIQAIKNTIIIMEKSVLTTLIIQSTIKNFLKKVLTRLNKLPKVNKLSKQKKSKRPPSKQKLLKKQINLKQLRLLIKLRLKKLILLLRRNKVYANAKNQIHYHKDLIAQFRIKKMLMLLTLLQLLQQKMQLKSNKKLRIKLEWMASFTMKMVQNKKKDLVKYKKMMMTKLMMLVKRNQRKKIQLQRKLKARKLLKKMLKLLMLLSRKVKLTHLMD